MLVTCTGGNGHFLPTLPIAQAAVASGHQVAYACQQAMVATVAAAGFTAFASGGSTLTTPSTRLPLQPVDRAMEEQVVRTVFAGSVARERAARLLDVARSWQPDVVLRDEMDFGAAVAAETLGLPHSAVIVIAAGGLVRPDLVAEPLNALRSEHGRAPDPETAMLHRYLTLVPVPPSYRNPTDRLPRTAHHLGPAVLDAQAEDVPPGPDLDWIAALPERPTIYFTLGTVFHQESGDLFTRVLAGLRELPANIVVTVGREIDPAELGEQPSHVRVERFVPQGLLLPRCAVIVSHAGSGSVIGALAYGVPSVLLPMGADQPLNGDRCAALGVGLVLDAITVSAEGVRRAVADVLANSSYRTAAISMQHEIRALPGAGHAVELLERLSRDRTPILTGVS